MKINDAISFFHFVKNNGLINLCPEVAVFIRCMDEYSRMCSCDPEPARRAKIEQCRSLYSNFLSRSPQYKNELLSKTGDNALVLCFDGQTVVTLTR